MASWPWTLLLVLSVIGLLCPGLVLLGASAGPPPGWSVWGAGLTTEPTVAQRRLTGVLHLTWGLGLSILSAMVATGSVAWPSVLAWLGPAVVVAAAAAGVTVRLAAEADVYPIELYSRLPWLTSVASAIGIIAAVLLVDRIGWGEYAGLGLAAAVTPLVLVSWYSITTTRRDVASQRQGLPVLDPDDQQAADAAEYVDRTAAMRNLGIGVVGLCMGTAAVIRFIA
jgi:hypothetical protein